MHLAVDAADKLDPPDCDTEKYGPPAPTPPLARHRRTDIPTHLNERFAQIDATERRAVIQRRRRKKVAQVSDCEPILVGVPELDQEPECDGHSNGACNNKRRRPQRKKRQQPRKKKPGKDKHNNGDLPYAFFKVGMLVIFGWLGLTLFTVIGGALGILGAAFLLIAGLGKFLAHVLGSLTDGICPPKRRSKMPIRWFLSLLPWALYQTSLAIVWIGDHASHFGLCGGNYALQGAKWFFTFRRKACEVKD
jgi:hypothetical protein